MGAVANTFGMDLSPAHKLATLGVYMQATLTMFYKSDDNMFT